MGFKGKNKNNQRKAFFARLKNVKTDIIQANEQRLERNKMKQLKELENNMNHSL